MTDLEKFVDLYKSIGIECVVNNNPDKTKSILLCSHTIRSKPEQFTLSNKNLFIGHLDFYSEITFDKDGKFVNQGFWE